MLGWQSSTNRSELPGHWHADKRPASFWVILGRPVQLVFVKQPRKHAETWTILSWTWTFRKHSETTSKSHTAWKGCVRSYLSWIWGWWASQNTCWIHMDTCANQNQKSSGVFQKVLTLIFKYTHFIKASLTVVNPSIYINVQGFATQV